MADSPKSKSSGSSQKSSLSRSQKIIQLDPADSARPQDIPEESVPVPVAARDGVQPPRSHASSKSTDRKKKATELALRQRSQSLNQSNSAASSRVPSSVHQSSRDSSRHYEHENPLSPPVHSPPNQADAVREGPRPPLNVRSTSAIAPKSSSSSLAPQRNGSTVLRTRGPHIPFPALPSPKTSPEVSPAPASGMYWSRAPISGSSHTCLRAHTSTLVGSNTFIFGGCDSRSCFNELYVLDADSFYWSNPHVCGEIPVPLRAMTCTAVGKKLIVFGGGDGPAYYNDIYVLDTVNMRWCKPRISGPEIPTKRRAHTACLYKNGIYVFGGGDGVRALNDVWRLDVSDTTKMSWKLVSSPSSPNIEDKTKPKARGYHTCNIVGSKLIIFGGSDGGECFRDVWVFDIETSLFSPVSIAVSYPRLSHTATIVGSYLFVIGGHDGVEYSNEVLLLNLVTMVWDKRKIYGEPLKARGYHGTVLHDSRLVVVGGFDGAEVFGDVWVLELAVHAYYSQISHFSIDV